jgi:hypothetical protein
MEAEPRGGGFERRADFILVPPLPFPSLDLEPPTTCTRIAPPD